MHEELKARLLAWTKTSSSFGLDSIGKDIANALEAIEQLERQLEEARGNYLGAMTDCGNLERQLAERDAEIAKYRDAPVVDVVSHSRMGLNSNLLNTALRVGTKLIVKPGEQ